MTHPIDTNDAKCRISEGCFFAIGSFARCKLVKNHLEDDCGVDFHLKRQLLRNGKLSDCGTILDFQLKATVNWFDEGSTIRYALKNKNFNDMVDRNIHGIHPLILVLMCLPHEEAEWVSCEPESISFRRHLFWYHSEEAVHKENEESTTTLYIPKANRLTHESFSLLVNQFGTRRI